MKNPFLSVVINTSSEGVKMPKWGIDIYFTACKTVEIEADNYLEAREKGLGIMKDLNEEGFSIEGFECYRVWEEEAEE